MNLWLTLVFACFAQLASATFLLVQSPSTDPFYQVPANVTGYKEGEVIAWRQAPLKIRNIFYPINSKNVWQFLVRSTDGVGNATAIVTTVIEPYDADPKKVLSYQFAEDAASPDCAPSYSILFGGSVDTIAIQVETYLINPALERGWYVVTPDYEGPQAAFTVGKMAGRATLDSIRAILQSEDITGIDPEAKVAMWGYSGGTIATGWAAQLQPAYAPELKSNLIGAAVGGWTTNLTATVQACEGTIFSGLIASGIQGLINQYPWHKDYVLDLIGLSLRRLRFEGIADVCLIGAVLKFPLTRFFSGPLPWFRGGWDFFHGDVIAPIIREVTQAYEKGDGVPEIPMFVYHGHADEIVPFEGAERCYNNYCSWGIESLEFSASKTAGHILEAVEGAGAAIKWLDDRFKGLAPVKGCQRTERRTNLDYPGADLGFYRLFKAAIQGVVQHPLGAANESGERVPLVVLATISALAKLLSTLGPLPLKRDLDGVEDLDYNKIATMMIMGRRV